MIWTRSIAFTAVKAGNPEEEWEDGVATAPGGPAAGLPRFVVVDGATAAVDVRRWVDLLVSSFIDPVVAPQLSRPRVRSWFATLQERWLTDAPQSFATPWAERKFREQGSFATLLGCEIDTRSDVPSWRAVAIGDTVLFHVRAGALESHFPPITPLGFGLTPDLVHTRPERLDRMVDGLGFAQGELAVGDVLFLATDALAHWMLCAHERGDGAVWALLDVLDHPRIFDALVADLRASAEMDNDDVTLVRVHIDARPPERVVVCL